MPVFWNNSIFWNTHHGVGVAAPALDLPDKGRKTEPRNDRHQRCPPQHLGCPSSLSCWADQALALEETSHLHSPQQPGLWAGENAAQRRQLGHCRRGCPPGRLPVLSCSSEPPVPEAAQPALPPGYQQVLPRVREQRESTLNGVSIPLLSKTNASLCSELFFFSEP